MYVHFYSVKMFAMYLNSLGTTVCLPVSTVNVVTQSHVLMLADTYNKPCRATSGNRVNKCSGWLTIEIDHLTSSKCPACGLQQGTNIVTVHKSKIFILYTMPDRCCALNCTKHDEWGVMQLYRIPLFDKARSIQWA